MSVAGPGIPRWNPLPGLARRGRSPRNRVGLALAADIQRRRCHVALLGPFRSAVAASVHAASGITANTAGKLGPSSSAPASGTDAISMDGATPARLEPPSWAMDRSRRVGSATSTYLSDARPATETSQGSGPYGIQTGRGVVAPGCAPISPPDGLSPPATRGGISVPGPAAPASARRAGRSRRSSSNRSTTSIRAVRDARSPRAPRRGSPRRCGRSPPSAESRAMMRPARSRVAWSANGARTGASFTASRAARAPPGSGGSETSRPSAP